MNKVVELFDAHGNQVVGWPPLLSDDQLKEVARQLCEDEVFTDRMIEDGDEEHIGTIFIALHKNMPGKKKREVARIGLIFEDYAKAVPGQKICGKYPMFMSAQIIAKSDMAKLMEFVKGYEASRST